MSNKVKSMVNNNSYSIMTTKTYDIAFYDMNIAFSDMNNNSYIQSNMTNLTVIMKISDV